MHDRPRPSNILLTVPVSVAVSDEHSPQINLTVLHLGFWFRSARTRAWSYCSDQEVFAVRHVDNFWPSCTKLLCIPAKTYPSSVFGGSIAYSECGLENGLSSWNFKPDLVGVPDLECFEVAIVRAFACSICQWQFSFNLERPPSLPKYRST